ncbi:hypothetical protein H5410_015945 [Solanum commersonii]|uniref:Uncharacterized protein n=1 Tax=Solanum commersonii TaxID=4109 RepID=A0A9J5ZV39_SOLCO|nr:hypothetical protein H5410_015945 [Solanum commersonii]
MYEKKKKKKMKRTERKESKQERSRRGIQWEAGGKSFISPFGTARWWLSSSFGSHQNWLN